MELQDFFGKYCSSTQTSYVL